MESSFDTTACPSIILWLFALFLRCVETALRKGIRVLFYVDDLIVMASSRKSAALHTAVLVKHLSLLGFAINWEKSSPLPSQSIVYPGEHMSSLDMRARLSPARLEALSALLSCISLRKVVPALLVMCLLGMMSASHVVVPLGLLHIGRIQRWFGKAMYTACLSASTQSDTRGAC